MPSKRRPKGEGSITVLPNGKVRIRVELDPVDGKRKWLTATAKTKKEAVEKLKKLQRDKEDNVLQVKAAEDTIDHQAELYKQHLRAMKRSGSILRQFRYVIKDMIDLLHNMALSKITSHHIDKLLLMWHDRGLQQSTIDTYASKLSLFFEWCVLNEKIAKNPLQGYKFKKRQKKTKESMIIISQSEHEQIKEYLYSFWERKSKPIKRWGLKFRLYALYCLAYETGMRDGEIATLKWQQIDFEHKTVRVVSTLALAENDTPYIKDPKTDAGFRTIIISDKTTQLLADLKEFSGSYSEFVFYNHKTHKNYWGSAINLAFCLALKRMGITRPLVFHDIRHTNASNMIYKHVPIAVITERLGHSSIAVTYSTYGHIIKDCEEANIAVVEA